MSEREDRKPLERHSGDVQSPSEFCLEREELLARLNQAIDRINAQQEQIDRLVAVMQRVVDSLPTEANHE